MRPSEERSPDAHAATRIGGVAAEARQHTPAKHAMGKPPSRPMAAE